MLQLIYFISRFGGAVRMSPEERFWCGVIVAVIFGGAFIYLVYRHISTRDRRSWDKGMIPKNFKPTQKNILELFIAASGAIVRRDMDSHYLKFSFIDKYLKANFEDIYYNAAASYNYSMRHVVKIDSLASWSNKYLSKEWKIKLINFLAGIAAYDGGINDDEQRHLLVLMTKMNLELIDFEPIYAEKLTRKNERIYTNESSYSKLDFFYKILGLEKTASIDEVKAAYRRLVKLTHPDRFVNESPEIQKHMSEKFREVQTAYEFIVNS
ncbi:DnaJ domain-containing protein [Fluviicola taffensis]|uniref:Heat shock protein DnaJ domain protein n=1 Tax=Fluviicola taffensis (strain DSM 16823 / NCIMB 13979 / RW262) TaxID=755732 RepID=F2IBS3_FLUTR|nr:DnaJ domain-containing protein [Fluviicola taffensis]AEA45399.1 heat shock protein DnaJ domain protein [Fluviicola taffensis DSM 16823]